MFENKTLRFSLFGLLYFAQGSILSYFTALNAIYLLSFGLSMSQVGIFSAIALAPFILKIFLGMLSDRVNLLGMGHRKPYIILGLLVQSAGIIAFSLINPATSFALLVTVAFLVMTGMALYDTCTDGLALDTTDEEDEGTVQGIMVGGRALGVVVVSGTLGFLAQTASWAAAFAALASITLVPLIMVLGMKEPVRPAGRSFEWQAFHAFGKKPVIALALLGALYSLLTYGANEIVNPFLSEEFGIDYVAAGLYTAIWGLGVVAGGLTGGQLTDRIGQKRALQIAVVASLLATLLLASILGPGLAWPIAFGFGLAFGYYDAVFFAVSMRLSDLRIAASMFALLMAIANLGTGVGFAVSGVLVDSLGYRWTFVILSAANLLVLPLIQPIFGKDQAPHAIHTGA